MALELRQKLAAENPTMPVHRNALAGTYTRTADVYRALGRIADAIDGYERAVVIREVPWRANPNIPQFRSGLAKSVRRLGLAKDAAGDAAGGGSCAEGDLVTRAAGDRVSRPILRAGELPWIPGRRGAGANRLESRPARVRARLSRRWSCCAGRWRPGFATATR